MIKQKIKAFTLVELIVVITILAILGTIAFISLQGYSRDARDAVRKSDINSIKISLELFKIQTGNYTLPDDYETIIYQSDNVWHQGTVGNNMTINLQKLSEKPTDPLFGTEYIYSVTESKKEYEVLAVYEGNQVSNLNIVPQTYADTVLYPVIDGTYNQVYVKTKNFIIPIPSIINSGEITGGMVLNNETIKSQVVSYGDNMPEIGTVISNTGGLDLPLLVYTGSITETSSDGNKSQAILIIQEVYSGSTLQNEPQYAQIILATEEDILDLADNLFLNANNQISSSNQASDCTAGTIVGNTYTSITYIYDTINNLSSTIGTGTGSTTNGVINYTGTISCNNGTISISNEDNTNLTCNNGYVEQGLACVLDECGGSIPANAVSNATSQSASKNWAYDEFPGVCKFICNTNYTWNGTDTCVADTQIFTCETKPVIGTVWNTVSSYTQTWNGSSWLPVDSITSYNTSASTTSCRYKCDTGYSWSGTDCVPTQYVGCTAKGLKLTATTTYGSCNTADIIICSGVGAGYTIAACNIGTNIAGTTSSSYGSYFQWGNNGQMTPTSTTSTTLVNASSYGPGNYYSSTIFRLPTSATGYDWSTVQNDNLWGHTTNTSIARQGPCLSGYHVPAITEWSGVISAGNLSLWDTAGTTTEGTDFMNTLKIPYGGLKVGTSGGSMSQVGLQGKYWSSTASGYQGQYLFFTDSILGATFLAYRSHGHSVRCFKN